MSFSQVRSLERPEGAGAVGEGVGGPVGGGGGGGDVLVQARGGRSKLVHACLTSLAKLVGGRNKLV